MNNISFRHLMMAVILLFLFLSPGCGQQNEETCGTMDNISDRIERIPLLIDKESEDSTTEFSQLRRLLKDCPAHERSLHLRQLESVMVESLTQYTSLRRLFRVMGRLLIYTGYLCFELKQGDQCDEQLWQLKLHVCEKYFQVVEDLETKPEELFVDKKSVLKWGKKQCIEQLRYNLALNILYGLAEENSGFPRYLSTLPQKEQAEWKRRLEKMMLGEKFIPWRKWGGEPRRRKK